MKSREIRTAVGAIVSLMVVGIVFVTCSEDSECPTCPPSQMQWVQYDNFNDDSLDTGLWYYVEDYGGQVLETAGQLQVWGHTDLWTGRGIARAIHPKLGWKFDLVDAYFEDGPGCQGWHISARDTLSGAGVELLNRTTAGCSNPPNMGDSTGTYEIKHEDDSLAVYKDGSLLRRVPDNGMTYFVLQFISDNVYGSGDHCHIFIDNVQGLEWTEWTP